jgi:hypothetical protein
VRKKYRVWTADTAILEMHRTLWKLEVMYWHQLDAWHCLRGKPVLLNVMQNIRNLFASFCHFGLLYSMNLILERCKSDESPDDKGSTFWDI